MGVFYGIKQPSSGQTGTLRNKQNRSGVYFRAWLDHGLLNQGLALAMKLNDHNFKGNEKLKELDQWRRRGRAKERE